jgi:hypothetical protein
MRCVVSTMTARATFMVAVLGLATLAGCIGVDDADPTSDQDQQTGPAEFTEDTGAVSGTVLDDQGLPVEKGQVALAGDGFEEATTTDEAGRFAFSNVDPGSYRLFINALGYESVGKNVDVVVGEVTTVEVLLEPVAVAEPHAETQIGEGKVACSVRAYPGVPLAGVIEPGWYTGVAVCGLPVISDLREDQFLIIYEIPEGAQELYVEMEWESNQATGKGLSVVLEHSGHANDPDYTFGSDIGESPLFILADEETMAQVANTSEIDCLQETCELYTRVFAAANTTNLDWPTDPPDVPVFGPMHKRMLDVGIVWEQRFTQYLTSFHNQTRPEDFTALQDA